MLRPLGIHLRYSEKEKKIQIPPMIAACPALINFLSCLSASIQLRVQLMEMIVQAFMGLCAMKTSGWGETESTWYVGLLHQPLVIGDGGMRIGWGNRSTRRKPTPVPLCSPQIPHDLTWARNRAAAVGSRRLTA
jgi:hypothetical protein